MQLVICMQLADDEFGSPMIMEWLQRFWITTRQPGQMLPYVSPPGKTDLKAEKK